uniref:Uncharacterized protein n=1 Tax=Fusarium oxysporum (strain Fo5176) TaxID=660025 RepID=A0A0D2XE69_FUSOF
MRDSLPRETVIFANGTSFRRETSRSASSYRSDGGMSAEGNLSDPAIFTKPPAVGEEGREYWRGKDGKGGYRVDAVFRRYMDILHEHVFGEKHIERRPLFMPGDDTEWMNESETAEDEPPSKKRRKDLGKKGEQGPNMSAMQPHLFHLLRHFVSKHTDVRDMLAKSRAGDMEAYERVLSAVERKVAEGLIEYERTNGESVAETPLAEGEEDPPETESSVGTQRRCRRPWWVVQPIIRPLPNEAFKKGALTMSKKDKVKAQEQKQEEKGKQEDIKARDEALAG